MKSEPGLYHRLVMGSDDQSFINIFLAQWRNHLKSFPERYQASKQLVMGSRLRPLLVCWGYLLSGENFDENHRTQVAGIAVYVELLHKATILIDDLVDDDDTRNGEASFHIEFSHNEAILFAIYLIGDCLDRLCVAIVKANSGSRHLDTIDLLSKAIKDMASGAIEEVTSADGELLSLSRAKRFIELQTISLIKNGLLTGYQYGGGNPRYVDTIDSVGYDCGYLFQVLNDLEPFLGGDLYLLHKGTANCDVLRSRKNITVAFISSRLRSSEQELLRTMIGSVDPRLPSILGEWFAKYDVLDSVLNNLALVRNSIEKTVESLPSEVQLRHDFHSFIDHVLSIAIERIGGAYGERLSATLIR